MAEADNCPRCGAERLEAARFCVQCGAQLEAAVQPPQNPPEAEEPFPLSQPRPNPLAQSPGSDFGPVGDTLAGQGPPEQARAQPAQRTDTLVNVGVAAESGGGTPERSPDPSPGREGPLAPQSPRAERRRPLTPQGENESQPPGSTLVSIRAPAAEEANPPQKSRTQPPQVYVHGVRDDDWSPPASEPAFRGEEPEAQKGSPQTNAGLYPSRQTNAGLYPSPQANAGLYPSPQTNTGLQSPHDAPARESISAPLTASGQPTRRRPAGSAAPPPPPVRPAQPAFQPGPSAKNRESDVEEMLADIDNNFDAIFSEPPAAAGSHPPSAAKEPPLNRPEDRQDVESLFKDIAASYLGPVRDFMVEVELGDAPKQWLSVCAPQVVALTQSAESMGLNELAEVLRSFGALLEVLRKSPEPVLTESQCEQLRQASAQLARLVPAAFSTSSERDRREPIIVQSLLLQVPGVKKVALDRIYAAGLSTLKMFHIASAREIAQAAGIPEKLASDIVQRFADYRNSLAEMAPEPDHVAEHKQLSELVKTLREQSRAIDEQVRQRAGAREKRRLREGREDTVLAINVLLARLGEVEFVQKLERLPYGKKAESLEGYLAQANS